MLGITQGSKTNRQQTDNTQATRIINPVMESLKKETVMTDEQLAAKLRSDADRLYKEAARLRKQADELKLKPTE